jgi:alpha-1,2-mannosyltransferase
MTHFWQAAGEPAPGTSSWQSLRSGSWLTADRARAYSLILLAFYAIAAIGWVVLSNGMIDRNGKPIGTDFASFYAAGSLALDGHAAGIYDMAAHYAREQQIFGAAIPYYGWLYPPIFLLVAAPLALLPYSVALIVWQGASFALYLAVIAAILAKLRQENDAIARFWLPVSAAFPAVFINLGHGQNGFLTAGLLGAALLSLPRRPLLAGILFGLLAYKPQFGLLIPVALLVAGQWRAISAAALTVIVLMALTTLVFGADIWWAFAASTETARKLLLEQGDVGFEKLQSVFAAVRLWGGGVPLAYWVQGMASLATICGVAWTWRACADRELKAALLMMATLLASPHTLDYDLTILGPAIAFLVASRRSHGFRDFDISLLAAAWTAPLLARGIAGLTGIPLGLIAIVALYALTMRHAIWERGAATKSARIAQA